MAPKHRRPARLSPRARRTWLGVALVAVLAPVAGVALGAAIDDVKECTEHVPVTVMASKEMSPVLTAHAKKWMKTADPVEGSCGDITVKTVDSASVATAIATENDAKIDVGDAKVKKVKTPDVWVPESTTWLSRLGGDLDGAINDQIDSVAESPVGLAVTQEESKNLQGQSLMDMGVSNDDPYTDPASLQLLMSASSDRTGFDVKKDSKGAKIMSQSQMIMDNQHKSSAERLIFQEAQPSLEHLDYPYVTFSDADAATKRVSDAFQSSLLAKGFTDRLPQYGLQSAAPYPKVPAKKDVDAALETWHD